MLLGMNPGARSRGVEDRRRRIGAPEWAIVADVGPASRHVGLADGQDRNGRVVSMQSLGGEHMLFDPSSDRL
jgi:hypothetical protein